MPRTTVFGWYDGNVFGAVERVQKHVPMPPNRRSAALAHRRQAALLATGAKNGRWSSAATTFPA
jgi:hypothetical protein